MTIEQDIKIRGETDFCTISRLKDGRLSISSFTMFDHEVADFTAAITEAIKYVGKAPTNETVQLSTGE